MYKHIYITCAQGTGITAIAPRFRARAKYCRFMTKTSDASHLCERVCEGVSTLSEIEGGTVNVVPERGFNQVCGRGEESPAQYKHRLESRTRGIRFKTVFVTFFQRSEENLTHRNLTNCCLQ